MHSLVRKPPTFACCSWTGGCLLFQLTNCCSLRLVFLRDLGKNRKLELTSFGISSCTNLAKLQKHFCLHDAKTRPICIYTIGKTAASNPNANELPTRIKWDNCPHSLHLAVDQPCTLPAQPQDFLSLTQDHLSSTPSRIVLWSWPHRTAATESQNATECWHSCNHWSFWMKNKITSRIGNSTSPTYAVDQSTQLKPLTWFPKKKYLRVDCIRRVKCAADWFEIFVSVMGAAHRPSTDNLCPEKWNTRAVIGKHFHRKFPSNSAGSWRRPCIAVQAHGLDMLPCIIRPPWPSQRHRFVLLVRLKEKLSKFCTPKGFILEQKTIWHVFHFFWLAIYVQEL